MKPRSAAVAHLMSWALRRHLHKAFAKVNISGTRPRPAPGQGVIVFSNHPAWWDPAVFALLQHKFFATRAGYGPMDAEALQAYPLLERAGFIPLDRRDPATLRRFITHARARLLGGDVVWITAEGRFRDPRERPLQIQPGVVHLAKHVRNALVIPLALEYVFGEESRAEVFLRFGNPVDLSPSGAIGHSQDICTQALTDTMDKLASAVCAREAGSFHTLETRPQGVGGVYDQFRKITAWSQGRRFDPRHRAPESASVKAP